MSKLVFLAALLHSLHFLGSLWASCPIFVRLSADSITVEQGVSQIRTVMYVASIVLPSAMQSKFEL